ncbi:MAG: hypothetical protein JW778_02640 [Candidatus Altiarchaeota archaeon]|nr:hypothetical protein [Candidatus Altiarchaeota archaeon]
MTAGRKRIDEESPQARLTDYVGAWKEETSVVDEAKEGGSVVDESVENLSEFDLDEELVGAPDINSLIERFRGFLKTDEGRRYLDHVVVRRPQEIQEIFEKLRALDRDSDDFTNLVLFRLLPNSESGFSVAPSFVNMKGLFSEYGYGDQDWNKLANHLFDLVLGFVENPRNLDSLLRRFNSGSYSKGLQCRSVTPMFYSLNRDFPLLNDSTRRVYGFLMKSVLRKSDSLGEGLVEYPFNVNKIRGLVSFLVHRYDFGEIRDLGCFDLFCYWLDQNLRRK